MTNERGVLGDWFSGRAAHFSGALVMPALVYSKSLFDVPLRPVPNHTTHIASFSPRTNRKARPLIPMLSGCAFRFVPPHFDSALRLGVHTPAVCDAQRRALSPHSHHRLSTVKTLDI